VRIHSLLAQSNASLVAIQLDDILGVEDAQNLPGTIEQHPNWQQKYDILLESLSADGQLRATAQLMNDAGRHNADKG
jgi:4-alpha-glucanotransferase